MPELTDADFDNIVPNDYEPYRSPTAFRLLITWDGSPETELDLMLDKVVAKHMIGRLNYMYKREIVSKREWKKWCELENIVDADEPRLPHVDWWPDVDGFPIVYIEFWNKRHFEDWFMSKRIVTVVEDNKVDGDYLIDVDTYKFYMYEVDGTWYLDTLIDMNYRRSGYWGSVRKFCKRNDIAIDKLRGMEQVWFEAKTAEQLYRLLSFASFKLCWSNIYNFIEKETINPTDEEFVDEMKRWHIYARNMTNTGSFDTYRYFCIEAATLAEFVKTWWPDA